MPGWCSVVSTSGASLTRIDQTPTPNQESNLLRLRSISTSLKRVAVESWHSGMLTADVCLHRRYREEDVRRRLHERLPATPAPTSEPIPPADAK
eukprot:scaffold1339_cov207-Alexandrium_tamarense.AAC.47